MTSAPDLRGRTVGVTADRRGNDQTVMFRRLGAEVVHAPTISTVRVPDPELLRARTAQIVDRSPDFLIANTGLGMRTWMSQAKEWAMDDELIRSLGSARIAARGPKAVGALSSAGLSTWWRSEAEQLADVVDHLLSVGVEDKEVVFQMHGDDAADVVRRLEEAGARVVTMPVYAWARPADDHPVAELIERCMDERVDAVTFTAGPQVDGLLRVAEDRGLREPLLAALNGGAVVVGCIGPVCASAAAAAGMGQVVVPSNWRLRSLVGAVADALAGAGHGGQHLDA